MNRRPDQPGEEDPGPGRRMGVDVGSVRVGVALSDPGAILASPLATLSRDAKDHTDLAELARLVTEHEAVEVIVGLPRTLADRHGAAAEEAVEYTQQLAGKIGDIPIRLVDERLSTVSAERMLSERGVTARQQRAIVDKAAAVEILQGWLDARSAYQARASGAARAPDVREPRNRTEAEDGT